MFRRSGKNPLEKEVTTPLYPEMEAPAASPYKSDPPPRLFDASQVPVYEERKKNEDKTALPHPFQGIMKEEPETTLGEGVIFRGELSFERLLRIDGVFEGELISKGKVIVGPKGKVKANLNLREAIVEGKVEGNINVEEKLELRGEAIVIGDITAKLFSADFGVTIQGRLDINPTEKKDDTNVDFLNAP